MSTLNKKAEHPGTFVRRKLPPDLTVKEAAKRMGVGRPALSNFLNGKAGLSREMAARLEATFKLNRERLMQMQVAYDEGQGKDHAGTVVAGAYAPSMLSIRAEQIESWADRAPLTARSGLAALLRTLVNSTGRELKKVDFPAFENSERPGLDGQVDAGAPTQWIPEGASCWEFGCNQGIEAKADEDFAKRTQSVSEAERLNSTFVFVTPRNWKKKEAWGQRKRKIGAWKDIRAFDASDLEQWLEQSVAGQVWFAERNGMARAGFRTLDDSWRTWSDAADPALGLELLTPSLGPHRSTFKSWLSAEPNKPLVVAADSRAEALAFICCLFRDAESLPVRFGDNVLVIDNAQAVRKLSTAAPGSLVMVADTLEVERELATLHKKFHCIVVRPRNSVDADPDIALDLLSSKDFKTALEKMGLGEERIERLASESGRSPTILRRRLASGAIKVPEWGRNSVQARKMVAPTLVGAWHTASKADCEIVSFLASGHDTEADIAVLRQLDDAPVWSIGNYRGVASKIDALFAIAPYMIPKDLEDFLFVAECVLSERDPALDLSEDKRWCAGLYGKVRSHSGAISKGIAETLVLLAVHGDELFFSRLGFNGSTEVALLVRRLLVPITLDKLLSQTHNLPLLAEAAPEEFLRILEQDLRGGRVVVGLLASADSGVFGSGCPRSGLLWALEGLAWPEDFLVRVSDILAELSEQKIDDNWVNKPENSLGSILRCWLPQTAAPVERRIEVVERLARKFPTVGWRLCMAQLERHQTGSYNHRPNWRNDASGVGRGVPGKERFEFTLKAVELALSWSPHDEQTLGDLVEHLGALLEEQQAQVWQLIERWGEGQNDEEKKATLRERIRRYAFTRRSKVRGVSDENAARARTALDRLKPADAVVRHAWLFKTQWVEESIEEYDDEKYDFRAREERIRQQRIAAISDIWNSGGLPAVGRLIESSGATHVIGSAIAEAIQDRDQIASVAEHFIQCANGDLKTRYMNGLGGLLMKLPDPVGLLSARVKASIGDEGLLLLFLCMPFRGQTWRALDEKVSRLRDAYWQEVWPQILFDAESDINEAADRLVDAKRPLAAFHCVHLDWSKVETSRLKKLLRAIATTAKEPPPIIRLSSHDVSEAFKTLNSRSDVPKDEMATLEFQFLQALEDGNYGIPNLERQIGLNSALFVQAIALAFRRNDGGKDPEELSIEDAARRETAAVAAHRLLDRIKRAPSTDEQGNMDVGKLKAWLQEVRSQLKALGRSEIGDERIGQLLSRAAAAPDGSWPRPEVCEALEWMASHPAGQGFHVAVRNSRGMHYRGEGGDQEREIAARYRGIAQSLGYKYPFVSSVIDGIAESYEREAQWEDTDAQVRSRLP